MTADVASRPDTDTSWYYCANCGRDPGGDAGSVDPRWTFCRYCGYQLTSVRQLAYGGFWARLAAYFIDTLLLLAALFLPMIVVLAAAGTTAAALVNLTATVTYFSVGNGLGGTLGRRALGLRVIDDSGKAPGIRIGFALVILSTLSRLALGLGYIWMIRDRRKQTWHDKLCGTYVVRTRTGQRARPATT